MDNFFSICFSPLDPIFPLCRPNLLEGKQPTFASPNSGEFHKQVPALVRGLIQAGLGHKNES